MPEDVSEVIVAEEVLEASEEVTLAEDGAPEDTEVSE